MTRFVNEGFGWECLRCRERGGGAGERDGAASSPPDALPRFFREGEAEAGGPRLSSGALARWADDSHTRLRCTACGAEEELGG